MRLSAGASLGAYKILSPLGAGGMGEVYRAYDPKLCREVALKVLPAELAADSDRMSRFEREARLLASLNDPGIAAIYGLEESDGLRAHRDGTGGRRDARRKDRQGTYSPSRNSLSGAADG